MSSQIDEANLIALAATGERSALATLVSACIARQFAGVTPFEALVMAEGLGRLAAAHGHSDDRMRLAGILRVRAHHVAELGDFDRAAALLLQSEAICEDCQTLALSEGVEFLAGVLTAEADAGDELAAIRLAKLTASLSATDADLLRREVNKACAEQREAQEAACHG